MISISLSPRSEKNKDISDVKFVKWESMKVLSCLKEDVHTIGSEEILTTPSPENSDVTSVIFLC